MERDSSFELTLKKQQSLIVRLRKYELGNNVNF
jgi:hypothetical protein